MWRNNIVLLVVTIFFLSGCADTIEKKQATDEEKAETYRELGVRYLTLGKPDVAMLKLSRSLELNYRNAKTHNAIAVAYSRLEKPKEAKLHFEKSLDMSPDDNDTLNNFGLFLCDRHEHEQAMAYLQKAISSPVNNTRWQALTNIGRCTLLKGNQKKAEMYFKKALLQRATFAPALIEMSKIRYAKGQLMSARAYLERYISAMNGLLNAEALLLGFRVEHALKAEKKAEEYRDRLFREFPDSAETEQLL